MYHNRWETHDNSMLNKADQGRTIIYLSTKLHSIDSPGNYADVA